MHLFFTFMLFRKKNSSVTFAEVESVYRTYGHLLRRRCARILRDESLVEDAMQEILIVLCQSLDQYRGDPEKILAWLYRVTTTRCLQFLDKNQRWFRNLKEAIEENENRPGRKELSMEVKITIDDFLEHLPPKQKESVWYYYVAEMSQEEIAELVGVSRDQVRTWLKHFQERGKVVLRK